MTSRRVAVAFWRPPKECDSNPPIASAHSDADYRAVTEISSRWLSSATASTDTIAIRTA